MQKVKRPGRDSAGWHSDDPDAETLNRGDAGWLSDGSRTGDEADANSKASARCEKGTPSGGGFAEKLRVFSTKEELKLAQRARALDIANKIRLDRVQLKRDLISGAIELEVVLGAPPECAAKVPVFEVLQWIPEVGMSRARKLIRGLVSETLPLKAMGAATRAQLIERFNARPRSARTAHCDRHRVHVGTCAGCQCETLDVEREQLDAVSP